MSCNGYNKSFKAMRLNVREEKFKEGRLKKLQAQEDKMLGIWAKRQLRIEQQIATKQSPLQRARRIRNKRQEDINRTHGSTTNEATGHKMCKKRLDKRINSCHSMRELVTSFKKTEITLPEEDVSRCSSSVSLPIVQTHIRRKSLPILPYGSPPITPPPFNNDKRPSLPIIESRSLSKACCTVREPISHHKLPPLKMTTG